MAAIDSIPDALKLPEVVKAIEEEAAWLALKPRVRKFIDAFIVSDSIADAERKIGWDNNARQGSKLIKQPAVRAMITWRRRKLALIADVDAKQTIDEIKTVAFATPEGKPTFDHKLRGLEMLGKTQKIFVERVEHSGNITLSQLVKASYDKPAIDVKVSEVPQVEKAE